LFVKFLSVLFCVFCAALVVSAQPASPGGLARSYSGQFTAREIGDRPSLSSLSPAAGIPMAGGMGFLIPPPKTPPGSESEEVVWVPARLVITCERVKELFLRELGQSDQWRGKIELVINSKFSKDGQPLLTGIRRPEGWNYQLELPKSMREELLVREVIQALLTELVNRGVEKQSAPVPFWLVEGMSAHLEDFNLPTYIIRPTARTAGSEDMKIEGLEEVRAELREHEPLSFQQLSWPEQSHVTGNDEMLYRSCALLLFQDLMQLNDGHASLQRMLREMSGHLNWQTAFLLGFHAHFASLLDVEKWWGLSCVNFTKANLTGLGTVRECWQKLQDALDVPVKVHLDPARLPTEARLTLQEVIGQWKPEDALPAVRRAVRDLQGLQYFDWQLGVNAVATSRVAPQNVRELRALELGVAREMNPLAAGYIAVLLNYIKQSEKPEPRAPHEIAVEPRRSFKQDAIDQLDQLDKKREEIRIMLRSASAGVRTGANAPAQAGKDARVTLSPVANRP
jgi:hypothetical protein